MSDEPRPQIDLSGAQTGDTSFGQVAGRDIYQGASADRLIDLLRERAADDAQYRSLDLSAREVRQGQLDRQLADLRAELRLQRWLLIVGLVVIVAVILVAL